MRLLADKGLHFVVNCVVTRLNCGELPRLRQLARSFGATLRVSRLRPTGRAEHGWDSLRPSPAQYVTLYRWLRKHSDVLTGDSFFFLSALGEPIEGLGVCGAGRVTCGITPEGDVFPCSFLVAQPFRAGNVRETSFQEIWRESRVLRELRRDPVVTCQECHDMTRCRGGCLAAKYHGVGSLYGRDPECVLAVKSEE
jgi:radical SAM protein with 4Fe4S-binding SPASM domain